MGDGYHLSFVSAICDLAIPAKPACEPVFPVPNRLRASAIVKRRSAMDGGNISPCCSKYPLSLWRRHAQTSISRGRTAAEISHVRRHLPRRTSLISTATNQSDRFRRALECGDDPSDRGRSPAVVCFSREFASLGKSALVARTLK